MLRRIGLWGAVWVTGAVLQAGALGQLGLTEATARDLMLTEIKDGNQLGPSGYYSVLADRGRKAYPKVPAAARASVTTALFAWAKAYAATPAFKAAYAKIRSEAQPQPKVYELTVEQEVQKNVQEQLAGIEEIKKAAATMSPADKARVLESAKQGEAMIRSPAILNADRAQREEARVTEQASFEKGTKEWQARYPAEVKGYVAMMLHQFLDATAGVDFSAKLVSVTGEGGDIMGFADPAYQKKPWQWVDCIQAGPDAVNAARSAAESWLKELES